jgi:hypothetical protein
VGGREGGRRRGSSNEEDDGDGSGELGHFLFLVMLADGCARDRVVVALEWSRVSSIWCWNRGLEEYI